MDDKNSERFACSLPAEGSKIHFIGIGGSSMSGLALLSADAGYIVSGSDREESRNTLSLREKGFQIHIGQRPENITPDISLVVYTIAVGSGNPELKAALSAGIPAVERGTFLGLFASRYIYTVSVTGTHGKTTTTSMLSSILLSAGLDPAIHIGGHFPLIGSNVRSSGSDYFITEACEYYEHMLKIPSFGGIILNVESEHMDYYKTDDALDSAFSRFAAGIPDHGFLVVCAENARAMRVSSSASCRITTYASADSGVEADYCYKIVSKHPGPASFEIVYGGRTLTEVTMKVPGNHNISNALAAACAAFELGVDPESVKAGLEAFEGTGRRFELVGNCRGAMLIDDYAHHPTEISATLDAAGQILPKGGRIIAIIQIHTFTRARDFVVQFAEALKKADLVYVTDIYAAREPDPGDVSGESVNAYFVEKGINSIYISDFAEIAEKIRENLTENDIVLSLGAGDVNKIVYMLAKKS